MRVLIINKFLYPNGGSETYIFKLGEALEQHGHEVQYFGMEHEGRRVGNRVNAYTSDIDLVLIIEAVDANFGKKFWECVKQAGYEHCNKSSGVPQFYRFSHPITNQYPAMIELFTRKLDAIQLPEDAVLTPLPMDEDISSLSAILLDDDYYEFLKQGKVTVDGVTVLDAAYLIPFKAKAWMDLTDRKAAGEHVDSKNIKKHKNDVFRLTELIDPTAKVVAPQGVYADIQEFVQRMKNENVDIKQLGLVGRTKEKILEELKAMYEELSE